MGVGLKDNEMDDSSFITYILIFSPFIILNIYASYVVLTTYFEVKERRFYQLILIWVLPLLGAITVILINREDRLVEKPKRKVGNDTSIKNVDNRF
jgi:hypothetical protein